jgi:3-oxoacyl-[acyl-carrier protein] reductase
MLHASGANIMLHYRSSGAEARELQAELNAVRVDSVALVQADLLNLALLPSVVNETVSRFGRLDVLVNNVGDVAPEQMSWRDVSEELVDRVLAVDVKGTLLVTHEVGSRMLEQEGGGAIVNVCSNVVVTGSPRAPQYAASKYGVLGLTKSYAHAFAPHVRVNALGPGFMETESTVNREDWRSGRREQVLAQTPLGRIPQPEELVGVVVFLASDDSAHMTGNFVLCDGGFSMVGA